MTVESGSIQSLAFATAERSANILQENLQVESTYWVPVTIYQRNTISPQAL